MQEGNGQEELGTAAERFDEFGGHFLARRGEFPVELGGEVLELLGDAPGFVDALKLGQGYVLVLLDEVLVNEIEHEFCRVDVEWDGLVDSGEVGLDVVDGPEVTRLSRGEQEELVEEFEYRCRRLMD